MSALCCIGVLASNPERGLEPGNLGQIIEHFYHIPIRLENIYLAPQATGVFLSLQN